MKTRLTLTALLALALAPMLMAAAYLGSIRADTNGLWIGQASTDKVAFHGVAPVARQTLIALTENSAAIGGTNDADLPSLTATSATLTGSLTGTANGSLVDVAAAAAATAGEATPSATQVDAGIATAVATIVSGVNEQNKEMQAQINALIADNVALRAAIRENAAQANLIRTRLVTKGLVGAP